MKIQGRCLTGKAYEIDIKNGYIQRHQQLEESDNLDFLAPGFVDLQINGFASVDFNSASLTSASIKESFVALAAEGYTSILPTFITNDIATIGEILSLFQILRKEEPLIDAMIAGYHIEGPFISPLDGPRGAHDKQYVQAPKLEALELWQTASEQQVKIITLSPEWACETFIQEAVKRHIKISIGHSAASEEQVMRAVHAGASASTHLGNGCFVQMDRHHNILFPQLNSDALAALFIGDGFHLPKVLMELIYKLKRDKAILTSDATSMAGLPAGTYKTHVGGEVILTDDGRLCLKENPKLLAGSALSLLGAVRKMHLSKFLPLAEIWKLASYNPAQFLHRSDLGQLEVGSRADFVLFTEKNGHIHVKETWIKGQKIYES